PGGCRPDHRGHARPELLAVFGHSLERSRRDGFSPPSRGAAGLIDQIMTDDGTVRDVGPQVDVPVAAYKRLPFRQAESPIRVLHELVAAHAKFDHHPAALGASTGEL